MKILYDYQIFLNQIAGGPSRYYCKLINEISKSEDISICAPLHLNEYLINLDKKFLYGYNINNFFLKNSPHRIQEFILVD